MPSTYITLYSSNLNHFAIVVQLIFSTKFFKLLGWYFEVLELVGINDDRLKFLWRFVSQQSVVDLHKGLARHHNWRLLCREVKSAEALRNPTIERISNCVVFPGPNNLIIHSSTSRHCQYHYRAKGDMW